MKCSFCHAPLPLNGLNCKYCGKLNQLNFSTVNKEAKESYVKSKYSCPLCQSHLNIIDDLKHCQKCDGLFLTEEQLFDTVSKTMEKKETNPHLLRFIQNNPRDNRRKTQYLPCPICEETMQHLNYKKVSGVIVDFCEEHGIWLDGGELRQIIEWEEIRA